MLRSLKIFLTLNVVLATHLSAQIAINEVFTGTPDHIELYNCSATAVNVSGWTVATWYATGPGPVIAETPFLIPTGTSIPAGGFLILEEFGTAGAPGSLPNSISVGFNYFWVASRTLEVALTDSVGIGIDYVYLNAFANPTAPNLPLGTNWTGNFTSVVGNAVGRNSDLDTDDASNWTDANALTTAALNPGQTSPICGIPLVLAYQVNSSAASMEIDGVQSNAFQPAVTNSAICLASTITLASSFPLYEIVLNTSPLVPGDTFPGVQTSAGQFVNINLLHASTFYLNGGTTVAFSPFAGFSIPFTPNSVFDFSAQAVFPDPTSADGFSLSQGVEYHNVGNPAPFPGPVSNDGTVLIDLATNGCGPVSFLGTSFNVIGVSANGRVSMGVADGDFSPTLSEAMSDAPFLGFWSDLSPASGGSISITDGVSTVSIDWVGVPYASEPNTANSFSIVFDRSSGDVSFTGLNGIVPNPATSISSGDAIFLGVSPGNGATDPGPAGFSLNGGGIQILPTDMIYEFTATTAQTAGTPFSSAAIAAGVNTIIVTSSGAWGSL